MLATSKLMFEYFKFYACFMLSLRRLEEEKFEAFIIQYTSCKKKSRLINLSDIPEINPDSLVTENPKLS